jgi:hypothetical protein
LLGDLPGSQTAHQSPAFDPDNDYYYTPEGIAERKHAKREKRAQRKKGDQAARDSLGDGSGPFSSEAGLGDCSAAAASSEVPTGAMASGNGAPADTGAPPVVTQNDARQEDDDESLPKKKKKKRKASDGATQEWISGPGNAEEAVAIRQKLGGSFCSLRCNALTRVFVPGSVAGIEGLQGPGV